MSFSKFNKTYFSFCLPESSKTTAKRRLRNIFRFRCLVLVAFRSLENRDKLGSVWHCAATGKRLWPTVRREIETDWSTRHNVMDLFQHEETLHSIRYWLLPIIWCCKRRLPSFLTLHTRMQRSRFVLADSPGVNF